MSILKTTAVALILPFTIGIAQAAPASVVEAPPVEGAVAAQGAPAATIDTNNDGKADAWDRDGNGAADAWDKNGDGRPDAFDDNGDGKPDPAKR
jgi:hypothetical protein